MEKRIPNGLKNTFLVHFIVGVIFGISLLLFPQVWRTTGYSVTEPAIYRLLGGAILGFTFSSWLAYREPVWDRVNIVVQMEIVWTILATLILLWGFFVEGLPTIAWMNIIIMACFAIAFSWFYFRK